MCITLYCAYNDDMKHALIQYTVRDDNNALQSGAYAVTAATMKAIQDYRKGLVQTTPGRFLQPHPLDADALGRWVANGATQVTLS